MNIRTMPLFCGSLLCFAFVFSYMPLCAGDSYGLGRWGGNITCSDNTPIIAKLIKRIGDRSSTIEISDGVFRVSSITFPAHVTLVFRNGGGLHVLENETVTIEGSLEAGPVQIFYGPGLVTGAIQVPMVYPQWFGAVGDGIHDDAAALQRAADLAARSTARRLFIPEGIYRFDSDVVFRCHVESRGQFIKEVEIDESRTVFSNDLFLPTHYPKRDPILRFESDHPWIALSDHPFWGIREGSLTLPVMQDIPLADGSGTMDLSIGGVLVFSSTDFFSSRNVRKGAHYYGRNDICRIVSRLGDVFPEFAFDYPAPPDAAPWTPDTVYQKGDYCSYGGTVFKAAYTSGPDTFFQHSHLGKAMIGSVAPNPEVLETECKLTYGDGTQDSILVWVKCTMQVWYRPKDEPLTVDGLGVEVHLRNHGGKTWRIESGAVTLSRSNMTFNGLAIVVCDPEATVSNLLVSTKCVNNTFTNCFFSGATCAHLGYNILNSTVAEFRYNHCISTNSRKGMDGRHGKNIVVNGGFYNKIDDHYGRNYVIRDVTLSGMTVSIPNDSTPRADLQAWTFSPGSALGFNGANFHIENIRVMGGQGGILSVRSDIGDLYGTVTLRDVSVLGNPRDVLLYSHHIAAHFDYAHPVKSPNHLLIENVSIENPGRLHLVVGSGFGSRGYGPIKIKGVSPIGNVLTASHDTSFSDCAFEESLFTLSSEGQVRFFDCSFSGTIRGLSDTGISSAYGIRSGDGVSAEPPLKKLGIGKYSTKTRSPKNERR